MRKRMGDSPQGTSFSPGCNWCDGVRWLAPNTARGLAFVPVVDAAERLVFVAPFLLCRTVEKCPLARGHRAQVESLIGVGNAEMPAAIIRYISEAHAGRNRPIKDA